MSCSKLEINSKPFMVNARVNNVNIKMNLDSGASCSLISLKVYQKYFESHNVLNSNFDNLQCLNKSKLKVIGSFKVNVLIGKQKINGLNLFVVDLNERFISLMGLDWLKHFDELDWNSFKDQKVSATSHNVNICTKIDFNEISHLEIVNLIKSKFPKLTSNDFGLIKDYQARIILKPDSPPKFHKPYDLPVALREPVRKQLESEVNFGILEKVKYSEYASPIVAVSKKGTSDVRICGDFKKTINPFIEFEHYPLPKFTDLTLKLANCTHFSVIDLSKAYLQLSVHPNDRKYLTINTHLGLYRYNHLIYGVSSAAPAFQQCIDQILDGLPGTSAYLDDIMVAGRSREEAKGRLVAVLQRLHHYNVRINVSKSKFLQTSVEYVGHGISANGITTTQSHFDAVNGLKAPNNFSEVQKFLGLLNYYHHHLCNIATIARPLYNLKIDNFFWGQSNNLHLIIVKFVF
jgi:hypothetical protein